MAMLAEPRQRKRYNLVPRGKALYEDDSRFGTKMLEKMGWSKGKGLGAHEDGSQEFVRVRYKNDIQGLGFEDRDDQWTQHEDSFNGLLNNLNGGEEKEQAGVNESGNHKSHESDDDVPRVGFGFQNIQFKPEKKVDKGKLKEKISGISLEEKSKQSKARVHYKKFTRGKDLSQYSEKDLANIFGKKDVSEQESAANDFYKQLNLDFQTPAKEELVTKKEDNVEKKNFGESQIINSELSVTDYFKMKMAARKNRTKLNAEDISKQEGTHDVEDNVQDNNGSKKKKKKKRKLSESENNLDVAAEENSLESEKKATNDRDIEVIDAPTTKQKKKSKKDKNKTTQKDNTEVENEQHASETIIQEAEPDNAPSEKKKRKKKKCKNDENELEENQLNLIDLTKPMEDEIENVPKEKKKSKKRKNENPQDDSCEVMQIKNKKLNRENRNEVIKEIPNTENTDIIQESVANPDADKKTDKSKKKKKSREEVSHPKKLVDIDNINEKSMQELKNHLKIFNVYTISSFCAEKFRNINLNYFPCATLPQIEGYTCSQDTELNVQAIKADELRITNLWENTLSKYGDLQKPIKTYRTYVKEVIKARKSKKKAPKLNVKTWTRKNAFAII